MPLFNFGRKFGRRSNVYEGNEPEEKKNEAAAPENDGAEIREEDGIQYAKLITALDNSEQAVIESILRSAGIPYVIREKSGEGYVRVIMGFNVYGSDFFVPEDLLEDAAALLVPPEQAVDPDEYNPDDSSEDCKEDDEDDTDESEGDEE